ncbi:putative 3-isopropylmalate dehydratase [Helianthus annuus]|nr:putative 3-isopropylmalate dehydratase [Helianthus annuus]
MATSSFISSLPSFHISISKKKKVSTKIMAVMTPQTSNRKPSTTGSVKSGMTMTEKIFARASERTQLSPGENVWVNVDLLMTHDVCGPGAIGVFKKEFGDDAKANPDYKGVCHIALAQEGHCRPGEILVGTDSHTCTAGAFGQFATGIGNTDAGFVLGTGKLLLKVPPTLRFVLDGEMPDYLLAKDLILQIIGEISVSGATYKAMEFVGTTIETLSMEERMTLCNMVVEAGGKNGIVPADATTFKYLEDKTSLSYEPVYSDAQAGYLAEYRIDVTKLEPLVAKPHSPDNRGLARECKDVKLDRVYIGSCTGGKTEDFVAAAKILLASGDKVKVPTFIVPATQKVWMDLYTLPVPGSGGKTCSQIFEQAGCDSPRSPSCGACVGGPLDTYARMNEPQVCLSTTNRNFPGRMGHKEGQIYLASPYTAAASALTGFVTDPREFMH